MESETFPCLPAIDFSHENLKPGTPIWDSVKSQVRKAAEEYGCFKALFNQIPRELRAAMNEALEELFDLPLETKQRNVSEKPLHGYIGGSPTVPLYESLGIDTPEAYDKVESFTNVLWPAGNTKFSKTVHSFSNKVLEMDKVIRRMIFESLGVEKYFDEHMKSAYHALRVVNYGGPQTTEKKVGLSAHADRNVMTIVYQNQVNGLEVQTKDGEWINVEYLPNSLTVIIGESLKTWTNGRLYSPYHRVMMTGNKARHSAVMFSIPKEGYIIKAPKELVDEEHPLLYKPFDFVEYLKLRSEEVGKTN